MIHLTSRGPYTAKDQLKADVATKFIGRGSRASSTNAYRIDAGVLANCGQYHRYDIVFISAEGNRTGRLSADFSELDRAVSAHATFITDSEYHRNREYNIGEREVAEYLRTNGYVEHVETCYSQQCYSQWHYPQH